MEKSQEITEALQKRGFQYITLDIQGFRSGSMDEFRNEKLSRKILDRVKSLLYDKQGDANGEICRADFTV